MGILCKGNGQWKNFIYNKIYQENMSFYYFKNIYKLYFGGVFPIENISNNSVEQVFDEELLYDKVNLYEDGIELVVSDHYLVPIIRNGIVVYIGEKEKYGNVVIVEGVDGVNVLYGNVCNVNVRLYDSVVVGSYFGEACSEKLYLVFFDKDGYLLYDEYLN